MQIDRNEDTRIYEAAFHVIPSLEEADAAAVAAGLRTMINEKGGKVIGGEAPQLMRLAYAMQKDIDRKRHTFTSAYFGWVIFEAAGDLAHEVKLSLENDTKILRSLVVKTVKEAAEPRKHPAQQTMPERPMAPVREPVREVEKAPGEPMTVEAMDAEIAKLVVE
jgi:ribosomal protein S6